MPGDSSTRGEASSSIIPYGKALNLCDIDISIDSSIIYAMAESEWSILRCENLAFCFKHLWIIALR